MCAKKCQSLLAYNTRRLVNASDTSYSTRFFELLGINVHEINFDDGTFPPDPVIQQWIDLLITHFRDYPESAVAVHCKYGIGRSAVLVAIALMEAGMDGDDAVDLIKR